MVWGKSFRILTKVWRFVANDIREKKEEKSACFVGAVGRDTIVNRISVLSPVGSIIVIYIPHIIILSSSLAPGTQRRGRESCWRSTTVQIYRNYYIVSLPDRPSTVLQSIRYKISTYHSVASAYRFPPPQELPSWWNRWPPAAPSRRHVSRFRRTSTMTSSTVRRCCGRTSRSIRWDSFYASIFVFKLRNVKCS